MTNEHLIREITRRMEEKGIGQKRLALEADLKETYVRDILKGKSKRPDVFSIGRLAQVLGCSIEELVGLSTVNASSVDSFKPPSQSLYTEEEIAIVDLWRSLVPNQREHLIGLFEAIADRRAV
ncbi:MULTISPECIES: helix-turn-helix domain-containing protein [unclassified Saccharibacter]|uniref:helix-turn-helix domain-containing protein n=1 Tax=unclassified Saccharibacter TaxID=2648722 RepID=UPI00132B6B57|nr:MULTISPECIES: helix-turn-helix transcriptional regulator [unclassified Saccharibacter]MXV35941.1 helix-turn-helix domain-containing protein [Saccharibacter sp. EH611]MXV58375.1 helix-turn-helix domain-containing protein [Saccharibacter sp. EH70]MXV65831.1 helix-turn-helix domain-containing protein [Saccharibacter sp. EH60]